MHHPINRIAHTTAFVTSRGALAGTRNSSMGPTYEGSIRRPIVPWANALPLSYVPLLFEGTPMIGQTPINIAALTLNTKLVSLLFSYGAVPTQQNSEGETVFHSLVEYARIRPNKVDDVINMMQHIVAILKMCIKPRRTKTKLLLMVMINTEQMLFRWWGISCSTKI